MASSTTRPIASTMASRVSVFTVKPSANMMAKVPISDTGMVTTGISEPRTERRNSRITTTTRPMASTMVQNTDLIDSSMNTEVS
jgi:hypothetical protein